MLRTLGLYVCIGLGLILAFAASPPPAPVSERAPANVFSAERAMADVRAIARAPHPLGSAENRRVREHVMARLRDLGLEVTVQRAAAVEARGENAAGAWVENVIGVLPGSDRSLPPVVLMSHYDSVPGSPAAADDTAGVAASLEAIRALTSGRPPVRDVVVLVTDGEEMGLFGARAFWSRHPLASRIGAVVNLETRGSTGPAFMFETGPNNGGMIGRFADVVRRPEATSLSSWVYDRMPNGSDFTLPKEKGVSGVNIAFIGRPFDYHSATATPDNLDRRSLQHMGDQTLAVVKSLAREPALPATAPNAVYADLFGRVLVVYPAWAGWVVWLAAAGLAGWAMWRTRREGELGLVDLGRGASAFFLLLTGVALVLRLAYRVAPVGPDFYQSPTVAQWPLFFAGMALLGGGVALAGVATLLRGGWRWPIAGAMLLLGLLCCLFGRELDLVGVGLAVVAAGLSAWLFGRGTSATGLWAGLLTVGLVLGLAMQAFAPGTAILVVWPVLVAAAIAAVGGLGLKGRAALTVALVLGLVAFAWLGRTANFLFDGLGLTNPELLALFACLMAVVLAPLVSLAAAARWARPAFAAVAAAGAAVLVFVGLNDPASARYPAASHVMHVTDTGSGRSQLVGGRPELSDWTRRALSIEGGKPARGPFKPLGLDAAWIADARPQSAVLRAVVLTRTERGLRLQIPAAGARDLELHLTPTAPVSGLVVEGQPVDLTIAAGKTGRLRWYAPDDTLDIAFTAPPGSMQVAWSAITDGWPAGATPLPPRPATVMPVRSSDTTVATGKATVRW